MGLWPFGEKSFLDPEDEAWQIDAWRWMAASWGGLDDLKTSPLVTPTREFFPPTSATGHARAEHAFAAVKDHAGMAEWECQLVAQGARPQARLSDNVFLDPHENHPPLGTFGVEGNAVVITYDPAALDDPLTLVATLAHELCHYRIHSTFTAPPGGPEMEEPATDLATVWLGFGLFGANTAFRVDHYRDGHAWRRQGYLDQRHWVFALAVFFALRGEGVEAAKPWLADHLWSDLKKAARYLAKRPGLLAPVREAS